MWAISLLGGVGGGVGFMGFLKGKKETVRVTPGGLFWVGGLFFELAGFAVLGDGGVKGDGDDDEACGPEGGEEREET